MYSKQDSPPAWPQKAYPGVEIWWGWVDTLFWSWPGEGCGWVGTLFWSWLGKRLGRLYPSPGEGEGVGYPCASPNWGTNSTPSHPLPPERDLGPETRDQGPVSWYPLPLVRTNKVKTLPSLVPCTRAVASALYICLCKLHQEFYPFLNLKYSSSKISISKLMYTTLSAVWTTHPLFTVTRNRITERFLY